MAVTCSGGRVLGGRRGRVITLAVIGILVGAVEPALANSGTGVLDGLVDVIIEAIMDLLKLLFSPIESVIEEHAGDLARFIVRTPAPDSVFDRPTNGPWPNVYDYYWDTIVPVSLFLYSLSLGVVILLESMSHLFSNYHRSKLKKRATSGLLGILSWWWICALALRFVDSLTTFLVPSLSDVSFFETLSFGAMGVIGLVFTLTADFLLFVLIGLVYLARYLMLYMFVLMMPLLIVVWIPGVGPFRLASGFARRMAGFFVPFLFMTVPVALLFRLADLIGHDYGASLGGIGSWLTALIIPMIALVAPFVLIWQAGAIFFVAQRAGRHASARRARTRGQRLQARGSDAVHAGRNFFRGVRDAPAMDQDGQLKIGSGNSRTHAAGSRLSAAGSRLRVGINGRLGSDGSAPESSDKQGKDGGLDDVIDSPGWEASLAESPGKPIDQDADRVGETSDRSTADTTPDEDRGNRTSSFRTVREMLEETSRRDESNTDQRGSTDQ